MVAKIPVKYIGFDGGVSVNPGGVDARGDGIKLYFTTDNKPLHVFIRIESIYIDLVIPGNAKPENAAVLINGYLSMKSPDANSPDDEGGTEYAGGISFALPKANIAGSAAMRYAPDTPSFLVDIGLELPAPIPIFPSLGIYGFRGLIGSHYVASMAHVNNIANRPVRLRYDYCHINIFDDGSGRKIAGNECDRQQIITYKK